MKNNQKVSYLILSMWDYYNIYANLEVSIMFDTASIPYIDFNTYILLGKYTMGGGCSVDYDRKVFMDEANNTITYKIRIKYSGLCDMLISHRNWVLVPDVPENYSLEFVVKEN